MSNINDIDIQAYTDKTVPSKYPFINKVIFSYIKGLLKGSESTEKIKELVDMTNPLSGTSEFLNFLDSDMKKFKGFKYRYPILSSINYKTGEVYQSACDSCFELADYSTVYGSSVRRFLYYETDENVKGYTDKGASTDAGSDLIPAGYIRVGYEPEKLKECIENIDKHLDYFKVLHTARQFIYFVPCLNLNFGKNEISTASKNITINKMNLVTGVSDKDMPSRISDVSNFKINSDSLLFRPLQISKTRVSYRVDIEKNSTATSLELGTKKHGTILKFDIEQKYIKDYSSLGFTGVNLILDYK